MRRLYGYRNPGTLNPLIGGHMKCKWKKCNGPINPQTGRCIMCGRSTNIALEKDIERRKAMVVTDWHTNSTDSYRERKIKRKYA